MPGFSGASDSYHRVQANRALDVRCYVVRTGACDPKRSWSPFLQSDVSATNIGLATPS